MCLRSDRAVPFLLTDGLGIAEVGALKNVSSNIAQVMKNIHLSLCFRQPLILAIPSWRLIALFIGQAPFFNQFSIKSTFFAIWFPSTCFN